MPLQKVFSVSSNATLVNEGTAVPAWASDVSNKSHWWKDGKNETDYFYSVNGDSTYIQYGQNIAQWASAKFFGETVKITNEKEADNGTITASVSVTPDFFNGRKTDFAASVGVSVKYTIQINNKTVYEFSGQTIQEFTNGKKAATTFDVTVAPQQKISETALTINVSYPNGEYPSSKVTVGFYIFNPNPVTYVPMATRKGGAWKDLNSNKGTIKIRKSNAWSDVSKENTSTANQANKGHNRIRKGGTFLQLPKMKGSEPD